MILENKFLIGSIGDPIRLPGVQGSWDFRGPDAPEAEPRHLIVINSPIPRVLSKQEAINLAAWLAAVADFEALSPDSEFQQMLRSVCNT